MTARTIVICCCLLMSVASHSQNSKIDSLRAELDDTNDNEKRADILHELSTESFDHEFDTSHEYALQSLNYAEKSSYTKGVVQALTDVGLYYYFTGDYKGARKYYILAIER